MLPESLIPTPLIHIHERPPVIIAVPRAPGRFRGLQILSVLLGLLARLGWWRLTGQLNPKKAGAETRRRLERLGGMWIKFGQLMSMRVDLFSGEFWGELSQLQDRAHGFPSEHARAIIAQELGGPIEGYFSELDAEPVAAASTAQVHRARLLKEGVEVAVKVQRPDIARSTAQDMKLFASIVRFLEIFGIASYLQWGRMKKELQQIIAEELDFRYEASSIRRMRHSLKKHHIYIPKPFAAISTTRMLVTEFLRGVPMSDYIHMLSNDSARVAAWREENGINPDYVGRHLALSLLRQIFEDNLYHGDLHPGNIMLLRDNRTALIDLGTVGITDNEFLGRYRIFIRSVGELNFAKAADALLLLGDVVPAENLNNLRTELIQILRVWSFRTYVTNLPFQDRSLSTVSTALLQILAAAKVTPDWSFLRIRRTEYTLDRSIIYLAPDINYPKIARHYFRRSDGRRLKHFIAHGPARAAEGLITAVHMGRHALEETLFTESVIRRDAITLESSLSIASYFVKVLLSQLIVGLVVFGLLAAACFLYQRSTASVGPPLGALFQDLFGHVPKLGSLTWLLILAADVYLLWIVRRLRARLRAGQAEAWTKREFK